MALSQAKLEIKMRNIYLGVNIDHVATVRNARGVSYPDPVTACALAELGGADSITTHLREDRRHITDRDVRIIRETVQTKLNLEMAINDDVMGIAVALAPQAACLVPERRQEVTTEGGLEVAHDEAKVGAAVERLTKVGTVVSLFIDPVKEQIDAAYEGTIACPCCGKWSHFDIVDSSPGISEQQAEQMSGMEMT